jgi:peptide/nickel transport system ATP-binding protein
MTREKTRTEPGGEETTSRESLLSIEELRTHIHTDRRTLHAVDGVSFRIDRGETVCLVGESGSGKTVTCESITGLVPRPPAEIVGGTVTFDGDTIHDAPESRLRRLRGDRIAHVFQNPQRSLDPVVPVGDQIEETTRIHRDDGDHHRERAIELLRRVGIPNAGTRVDDYPHEFSGGMCQRIAIAIAIAADPDLLIADEPTTSLDVTVQARLLELLGELTDDGMALLCITHDLRVVAALADRVLVVFGGTIVERGPAEAVFDRPAQPYTQALFESYDGLSRRRDATARADIPTNGCRFRAECPHEIDRCAGGAQPAFHPVSEDAHRASCVYYDPEMETDESILDSTADDQWEASGGTSDGASDDEQPSAGQ